MVSHSYQLRPLSCLTPAMTLPALISRAKYAYAGDLALIHSSGNWQELDRLLSQDMIK